MADKDDKDQQDDDLDTDLGDDEDEREDEDDDSEEVKPPVKADGKPYTQADIDALQTALRKSRKDARTARRGGPAADKGKDDGEDPEKARVDAESAAEAKWKPTVVRTAARAAFAEAGLVLPKGKADATMARALRLLDVDDLEINEDGDVEGLEEQIEEIKLDFPDLFATQQRKPGRVEAADRGSGGGKTKTTADLIAGQLLGSR